MLAARFTAVREWGGGRWHVALSVANRHSTVEVSSMAEADSTVGADSMVEEDSTVEADAAKFALGA
jgi:hypothetical protein